MGYVLGTDTTESRVSEQEALRLVTGYCRNPLYQLSRLRGNPYGRVRCEGGTLFFEPPAHCPSQHWNDGTDICADCGADLTEE